MINNSYTDSVVIVFHAKFESLNVGYAVKIMLFVDDVDLCFIGISMKYNTLYSKILYD